MASETERRVQARMEREERQRGALEALEERLGELLAPDDFGLVMKQIGELLGAGGDEPIAQDAARLDIFARYPSLRGILASHEVGEPGPQRSREADGAAAGRRPGGFAGAFDRDVIEDIRRRFPGFHTRGAA